MRGIATEHVKHVPGRVYPFSPVSYFRLNDDSWISKNFHVVEVKESLVADPSASPSSCKQSQSPKRLKKFDDADPPVKKAPAHYVFNGEPVPHSEASSAFD